MNNNHTMPFATGKYDLATGSAVATLIEPIVCKYGFHVALTGGCLYGEGGRKDIDLVLYRIRQVSLEDVKRKQPTMFRELSAKLQMELVADYGFVKKFLLGEIPLDVMFPEDIYGEYPLDAITAIESKQPLGRPAVGQPVR